MCANDGGSSVPVIAVPDKTKSMLMGRADELAASPEVAEAEIQGLPEPLRGEIYRELAKEDVPGDEILRVRRRFTMVPAWQAPIR